MNHKIRAAAERDLEEAARWYSENAADPRVAVRFLLEVRAVFEALAESPGAFPEVHRDIRRCRVLAFPAYSVFYRVLHGAVVITAVFHGRRRPLDWKQRR
ncbi:MAG: type II toxin-antitoxin system RelE/ParE family toxin [Polyangiaceae bacterium]